MKIDGFKIQLAKGKVTYLLVIRANRSEIYAISLLD